MPASSTLVAAEATPRIKLAVEMIPSFAPSTAKPSDSPDKMRLACHGSALSMFQLGLPFAANGAV
jgi:hypothetical protein